MLNGQWIELFRAGDYGDKGSYSTADIDQMVSNFNPSEHEPPVVMGHPQVDAPAYGWVEQVRRVGDVLQGKLKQVPEQFGQLVREGRFKKRSISIYRTASGAMLRHVGFLGAMPPEVKALADIRFASFSGAPVKSIEFSEGVLMKQQYVNFSEPSHGSSVDTGSVDLAEKAMEISLQQKIPYGDALNRARQEESARTRRVEFSEPSRGSYIDTRSVFLAELATKISSQRSISYAEALPFARRDIVLMSAEVPDAAVVKDTVQSSLRNYFTNVLNVKGEKVIETRDVEDAVKAVADALSKLKMPDSISGQIKADVADLLGGYLAKTEKITPHLINGQGVIKETDVAGIIDQAGARAMAIYTDQIDALRN